MARTRMRGWSRSAVARRVAAAALSLGLAGALLGAGTPSVARPAESGSGPGASQVISPQVNTAGKRKVPSFGLAKAGGAGWAWNAGYDRNTCRVCTGPYLYTSSYGDPWASGLDAKGRLVTVRLKERSVVVRRHATATSPGGSRKKIKLKKGWFVGGWHFGSDGTWYLATARNNPKDSKARAVLKVRRYSQSLRLLRTVTVKGGLAKTHKPYRAGNGAMVVHEGKLWLMLPQQEFKARDGYHHQAAWLLRLDFTRGKAEVVNRLASHSFGQYIASDGARVVTAEHGDAYPRAIEVAEHEWVGDEGRNNWHAKTTRPLRFPGRTGDNFTGATLNGLALGSTASITTGLSQPQRVGVKGVKGQSWRWRHNVWVAATNEQTRATSFRWITKFHPKRSKVLVGQPRLTQIAPDRFVLLYGSHKKSGLRTHYLLLDGEARTLAKKTFKGEFTPLAEPVLQGKRLVWINQFRAEEDGNRVAATRLAALNIATPTKPKRVKRR